MKLSVPLTGLGIMLHQRIIRLFDGVDQLLKCHVNKYHVKDSDPFGGVLQGKATKCGIVTHSGALLQSTNCRWKSSMAEDQKSKVKNELMHLLSYGVP